jgi:hypothetical protein
LEACDSTSYLYATPIFLTESKLLQDSNLYLPREGRDPIPLEEAIYVCCYLQTVDANPTCAKGHSGGVEPPEPNRDFTLPPLGTRTQEQRFVENNSQSLFSAASKWTTTSNYATQCLSTRFLMQLKTEQPPFIAPSLTQAS